ncbi:MAG TPA: universal stress protein [Terriglobales bacterium]|nr:universal stress protein [Terriglobales bacterium]
MYTRMLIPLDGSKVAEQVLPYARFLAKALGIPVELLGAVDPDVLVPFSNPAQGRHLDTLVAEATSRTATYLDTTARTIQGPQVKCSVEKGKPEDAIIDKAALDKNTLIVMATHGRSGIQRWLLGSVTDKVLHGSTHHLFLVRASDQGKTDGEAALKSVIVPLDGSALAEHSLPHVVDLAKKMKLEVVLVRAYALPPAVSAEDYGYYSADLLDHLESEARDYLQQKESELKQRGIEHVSSVVNTGYGAEEIITLARNTPDDLVAMCTHGRSGMKRWVLGSVTDRVVRHSGDPVLIIRAA